MYAPLPAFTMLRSPSVCPTSTSLSPSQWFSPTKSGKQITPIQPVVKLVSTRVVQKDRKVSALNAHNFAAHSTDASSSTTPVASSSKKRPQEGGNFVKRVKKPRVEALRQAERSERPLLSKKHSHSSRKRSVTPPNLVYRTSSRSRSVSTFESVDARTPRKCWTDEDGRVSETFISSEDVIKRLMHMYKAYFNNPLDPDDSSFEPHPSDYPVVTLEYPNDNASERFTLLEPKDKDHYNPIMCLEQTLHTIVEYYLTPPQQALFGFYPSESLALPERPVTPPRYQTINRSLSLSPLSSLSPSPMASPPTTPPRLTSFSSPLPTISMFPPQSSPLSTPTKMVTTSSSPSTTSTLTPLSSLSSNSSYSSSTLLRTLSRAIHTRNGPLFLRVMDDINATFRAIKYSFKDSADQKSNPLREVPKSWSKNGIPQKVLARIIEETYQRSVGPRIRKLKQYSAFTSEVYGELMPSFTSDIISATGLRPDSLFLDLGSGVGNVVLMASLQTGCRSFGIEVLPGPAEIADGQLEQFRMRCRMWGVEAGDVELVHGDMTTHPRVDELMAKADVVLVNNYVFLEELNNALRPKFLDLKEGAIVVSLKPFAPPTNHLLTERNVDDISSIFDVTSRPYHTGMVSWSSGQGQYYIHRVDRAGYNDCREQFERLQALVNKGKRARR